MPSAHAGGALQQRGIQGFDGGVRRKLDGGAKGWDDLSLAGDDELQWPQGTLAPAGAPLAVFWRLAEGIWMTRPGEPSSTARSTCEGRV